MPGFPARCPPPAADLGLSASVANRLAALRAYDILDTAPEPEFDDIVQLAAAACRTPVALISLVDGHRQWFKAELGLGLRETPLDASICAHATDGREPLVIPDATQDSRTAGNPLVRGAPGIRFYAGAPLRTEAGVGIGTVCVLDTVPRTLGEAELFTLKALARLVMTQLELRRVLRERMRQARADRQVLLDVADSAEDMVVAFSAGLDIIAFNRAFARGAERLYGVQPQVGTPLADILATAPEDLAEAQGLWDRALHGERCAARREAGPPGRPRRWLDLTFTTLRDGDGRILGAAQTARDVTRRMRAEAAQRQQAANQALLLALDDRLRALSDPEDVTAAASGLLALHLGVAAVAFVRMADGCSDAPSALSCLLAPLLCNGRVLAVRDVAQDPRLAAPAVRATCDALGIRAIAAAPLATDGSLAGVLYAAAGEPRRWTAADRALMRDVAERMWSAAERARAQAALHENAAELRTLTDALPMLVSYVDRERRYRFNNKAYEDWFGIAAGSLQGRAVRDVVGEAAYAGLAPRIDAALAGQRFSAEQLVPYRNGGARHVRIDYVPRVTPEGDVEGYYATVQDIGERVEAEAALRRREAHLAALVEQTAAGLCETDLAGDITDVNDRFCTIVGRWREELVGRSIHGVIHPADRAAAAAQFARLTQDGLAFHAELRTRRVPSASAWIGSSVSAIRDEDGRIRSLLAVVVDISERKRSESALRLRNEQLAARVEQRTADRDRLWRLSTDIMLVARFDTTITAVNPAWATLLGWREDELLATRFDRLIHPDDLAANEAAMARLAAGLTTSRIENRYRHYDGSYRWLSWTAVPDVDLIHAIARDITAERAAVAELAAAQETLRQAQKMEAVGQLTGGIAHDFNNMLAVVLGSLELLGNRLGSEDVLARRYAGNAAEAARRAAALTRRLLAFARQQPLTPEPIDANALVGGMSDLLRGALGEDVLLHTGFAAGLWPVFADPSGLENAVLNLAVNARDAMQAAGQLTIRSANLSLDGPDAAHPAIPAGAYVVITVADTGAGMPPEVLQRAFDPFFTTKDVGKGTGLGLSQVYGFVRQSGGYVTMQSEVGQGTAVRIYLPRHGPAYPPARDLTPSPSRRTAAVLVVDDQAALRQVTAESVRELGYDAIEADGADAALHVLATVGGIELLFTDVSMPGMDGVALAEAAQRLRPGIRVLFTSGHTREALLRDAMLPSGADVLLKPFRLAELSSVLARLLGPGAEAERAPSSPPR